jgi:hypothetical protein
MSSIAQANWNVNYYLSMDSGLRLGLCDYKGTRVIYAASVPFVYVNYIGGSWGPYTDHLKSLSVNVDIRPIMNGFDLKATYDLYGPDYLYEHVWRFHDDGQFGSTIVVHGPGEEIFGQHTYHVPFRFDLDMSGASGDSFQRWISLGWVGYWANVPQEGQLFPASLPSSYYDWQVVDNTSGKRAMVRAGECDNAEIWTLQYSGLESWSSWGGAQASPPGSPGSVPSIYDNNQSVQNTDIVLWYISHMSSRDLVASCGPWLRLLGF